MAQNIEIKAHAFNFQQQQRLAEALSDTAQEVLQQHDTFFNISHGRLKLREFNENEGQLIFYTRLDQSGPKLSDYQITETADPRGLREILHRAYGTTIEVVKTRYLYFSGRTRIHFDKVRDLGDFIELEVVLSAGEELQQGEQEAQALMQNLGINKDQLIDVAYADLLLAAHSKR